LHNEELHNLFSSSNMINVIAIKDKTGEGGRGGGDGMRNSSTSLVGIGKPRRRSENGSLSHSKRLQGCALDSSGSE
jgi:hypothetical protein